MIKVMYKKVLYLLILVGLLFPISNAFADSDDVDFSVTITQSLTLSLSSSTVNFEITPDLDGEYNSASFTVTSATNNATGYELSMTTDKVNLESNVVNPSTSANYTIPTLTETQDGISAATFEASTDSSVLNHYGVAIGANNNFNAMKPSNQVKKTSVNNASGIDTTTISLASKLDLATVPGTYSTTLNFQMVANPLPTSLEQAYAGASKTKATIGGQQYYALQDMNSAICEAVNIVDDELQVYDNRDNKIYWIAKLRDGHCWMTQNLDLDLEATATNVAALTSENTDLNDFDSNGYDEDNGYSQEYGVITWRPDQSTIPVTSIDSSGVISGWDDDLNAPYSVDTGNWYWVNTWYSDGCNGRLDCNYLSGNANGKFSQSPTGSGMHGHVGNYYNWSAAIASNNSSSFDSDITSDEPQNSICPAGWRLPVKYPTNDFEGLAEQYKGDNTYSDENDKGLIASPLWFVRGGSVNLSHYDSYTVAELAYAGYYGYAWTGTVAWRGETAYMMHTSASFSDYWNDNGRQVGQSVRCVAR